MFYPHEKGETEMAFDVTSKVFREITKKILFVNASSLLPLVLLVSPDSFSQTLREQTVSHPLLSVSSLDSHLLQPRGC